MLISISLCAYAQVCPDNIGFETGTFKNWVCYTGNINTDGSISVKETADGGPVEERHTIFKNSSPQRLDPYAGFPVNCPNGSGYSIQIGNSRSGAEAEAVSYTIDVPADKDDFILTYYYAVVLENPFHSPEEQPKFIAKVEDLTPGKKPGQYQSSLDCANQTFVASSGLPGFITIPSSVNNIQYKDWAPVNLHLQGYGGHKIRLTFTTCDCSRAAHFGYAYLDFDQNCRSSIISGATVCAGAQSVKLTAVAGYETYSWFNTNDLTKQLGTTNVLKITPVPPDGTKYVLIAKPYGDGICRDTIYSTINTLSTAFNFNVANAVSGCGAVDLTQPYVTAGSTADLKFEYFSDINATKLISDPKLITKEGTYYIRGTNANGCTDIKPVVTYIYDKNNIKVTQPPPACKPNTVDLTAGWIKITDPNVTYAYYQDAGLTTPVADPEHLSQSGTYYVVISGSCNDVEALNVVVNDVPVVTDVPNFVTCAPFDINTAVPEPVQGLIYKFYTDQAGTQQITNTGQLTNAGTYYYKAVNSNGCQSNLASINIALSSRPVINVTNPDPVTFPVTIDLTATYLSYPGNNYTYWKDAATTIPVEDYQAVTESGTYYVMAIDASTFGCTTVKPVKVVINPPPFITITAANTFSPNGDGINDNFNMTITGAFNLNGIKIFNRYGQAIFETRQTDFKWDGLINGKPAPAGTYYWVFSAYDIYRKRNLNQSGSVTIIR